jgi:hypothetical protein
MAGTEEHFILRLPLEQARIVAAEIEGNSLGSSLSLDLTGSDKTGRVSVLVDGKVLQGKVCGNTLPRLFVDSPRTNVLQHYSILGKARKAVEWTLRQVVPEC